MLNYDEEEYIQKSNMEDVYNIKIDGEEYKVEINIEDIANFVISIQEEDVIPYKEKKRILRAIVQKIFESGIADVKEYEYSYREY